jgi:uncharacterized protein YabE (DUF348 family)
MQHHYRRYRFLLRRKARKFDKHLIRHPLRALAALVFITIGMSVVLFLALSGNTVGANDANIVILYADRKTSTLPTREKTVGEFLEKEQITIHDGDVVEPSLDTQIQEDNFHINVYRAAPVVVYDGDAKMLGLSAALTPRSIAEQTGAKLYPEDIVTTEPSDDFLKDGSIGNKVVIERAVPAHMNLYGSPIEVRTHANTVAELLKEKHVQLAKDDTVTPALDTVLTPATQVFVTRSGSQVATVIENIPASVKEVQDNSLSFGTMAVRQAGSDGKKSVTYQIDLVNGKEVGRHIIQQVIIQQPVERVIARGQAVQIPSDKEGIMRAAGIVDSDFPYVYFIINHENALWCPTRWQGQNFCPAYYQEKFPGAETNTSTGYGLCQSTPAIKMATAGEDWRTNAVTQMKWCHSYAQRRHGGWLGAYNYWVSHRNW